MTQHTNSVVVAATRLRYRDVPRPGTFYEHVLVAVGRLAEHGHATVTPAQVAAQLELAELSPKGNTVYRTLHRLSDPERFAVPPLQRAGRGKFRSAQSTQA